MTFQSNTEQVASGLRSTSSGDASPKMDPALKAKWVEALRSGEYQQARCTLRAYGESAFCCIGVALDVQGANWKGRRAHFGETIVGSLDTPPSRLMGGLSENQLHDLMAKNDGTGGERKHSFPEIADYIEREIA